MPAQAESNPKQVVKSVSDVVLAEILANKAKLDNDPGFLMGLVENKMIPIIDQQRMAKLALGKNWKKISKQQQQDFIDGFKRHGKGTITLKSSITCNGKVAVEFEGTYAILEN